MGVEGSMAIPWTTRRQSSERIYSADNLQQLFGIQAPSNFDRFKPCQTVWAMAIYSMNILCHIQTWGRPKKTIQWQTCRIPQFQTNPEVQPSAMDGQRQKGSVAFLSQIRDSTLECKDWDIATILVAICVMLHYTSMWNRRRCLLEENICRDMQSKCKLSAQLIQACNRFDVQFIN